MVRHSEAKIEGGVDVRTRDGGVGEGRKEGWVDGWMDG